MPNPARVVVSKWADNIEKLQISWQVFIPQRDSSSNHFQVKAEKWMIFYFDQQMNGGRSGASPLTNELIFQS